MRRADRLFQIVQSLRRRRVTTAARLAEELGVSERTIYRDVRDLVLSGVPIEGEAGVGYGLPRGFDLPPLMFTQDEIEALVLGARIVESWGDPGLVAAAKGAIARIESVLPDRLKPRVAATALFAPKFHIAERMTKFVAPLREGITSKRRVRIDYEKRDAEKSSRIVLPLGLFFWGNSWSLAAWCELRDGFRNFRVDRIERLELLEGTFEDAPGRTLEDFFAAREDDRR